MRIIDPATGELIEVPDEDVAGADAPGAPIDRRTPPPGNRGSGAPTLDTMPIPGEPGYGRTLIPLPTTGTDQPRPPGPPGPPGPPDPPRGPDSPYVPGTREYPIAGGATSFSYPDFAGPEISIGAYKAPEWTLGAFDYPDFDHLDFVGPTKDTFQTDPGYEFRVKEGERAIKNARSAEGLLSTGGTLQELMNLNQSLAAQEFGNVFNRSLSTYDVNRSNKRDIYGTNRGNQRDIWGTKFDLETGKQGRALTDYLTNYGRESDDWTRAAQTYDMNLGKEMGGYGLNLDTSRFNFTRDQGQFGNLLSLFDIMSRGLPRWSPSA